MALGLDALVVNLIAVITGAVVNLVASFFGSNNTTISPLEAALGGAAWLAWGALYYTVFWSVTGQTPGDRLMGIRVYSTTADRIHIRQAFIRYWAMLLAFLPLCAGFIPVLTDDRRRGLHDRIAHTVVRWDEGEEVTAVPATPVAVTLWRSSHQEPTPGRCPPATLRLRDALLDFHGKHHPNGMTRARMGSHTLTVTRSAQSPGPRPASRMLTRRARMEGTNGRYQR